MRNFFERLQLFALLALIFVVIAILALLFVNPPTALVYAVLALVFAFLSHNES